MQGPSECHMYDRCAGHRDAVQLALRAPNREIATLDGRRASGGTDAADLRPARRCGRRIPVDRQPWFIAAKQAAAEWLIEHDILWPLADNAPWWLLDALPDRTTYSAGSTVAAICAYIVGVALLRSWVLLLWLAAAAAPSRAGCAPTAHQA